MSEVSDYWKPRVEQLELENNKLRRLAQSAHNAGQRYVLERMKGRGMHFDGEGGGHEETWGDTPSSEGMVWSSPEELLNIIKGKP